MPANPVTGTRQLVPIPAGDLARFDQELLSLFCLKNALYQLPTTELIDWLRQTIGRRSAIEIGAGVGAVGRALGIPLTDSYLQDGTNRIIADYYALLQQPLIQYQPDVRKLSALSAIAHYEPEVVVGCWITHKTSRPDTRSGNMWGVEEHRFKGHMDQYIMVGNERAHADKPVLKTIPHQTFQFDWLYSRSMHKDQNRIWVFDMA